MNACCATLHFPFQQHFSLVFFSFGVGREESRSTSRERKEEKGKERDKNCPPAASFNSYEATDDVEGGEAGLSLWMPEGGKGRKKIRAKGGRRGVNTRGRGKQL